MGFSFRGFLNPIYKNMILLHKITYAGDLDTVPSSLRVPIVTKCHKKRKEDISDKLRCVVYKNCLHI